MRIDVLLTLPLAGLLLAGCTSDPVGQAATRPASAAASPAPKATPTTPPPIQVAADATPIAIACPKLLPLVVARQLNPSLTRAKGWVPEAGSDAANIVGLHGTACLWKDTAGDTLELGVAKPSAGDATALKNDLVQRSNSVPTYGGEAYFEVVQHRGVVDAFRGRTWVWARSNLFYEPGDAADVVAAALAGLGLGPKVVAPSDAAPAATATASATPAATPSATPGQ